MPTPPTPSSPNLTPKLPTPTVPVISLEPKEPLFSAPIVYGQCVAAVKNLDDPKLLAYYDDLRVMNRTNLHRIITRAEFIKLVLNAGKVNLESYKNQKNIAEFSDIDQNSWYAPYVSYMVATKAMGGQEITDKNGKITKIFRPNDTITRAEASKILSELVRKTDQKLPTIEEILSFADVAPQASLSPYIQFAFNNCLLHGRNTIDGKPIDGKPRIFEPSDNITLAETSKVLYNITHSSDAIDKSFSLVLESVIKNSPVKNLEQIDMQKTMQNFTKSENIPAEAPKIKNISPENTLILMPTVELDGKKFTIVEMMKK